jgi:hypothetical protein
LHKTSDIPITFGHELASAVFPLLFADDAAAFYLEAVPFVTSIGKLTPLFSQSTGQGEPSWEVTYAANGFTAGCYRPMTHFWEWRGRTTIKIVGCAEYDQKHSIRGFKDGIAVLIQEILQ